MIMPTVVATMLITRLLVSARRLIRNVSIRRQLSRV